MSNVFAEYVANEGVTTAKLETVFDADRDAPAQMAELSRTLPQIKRVMGSLRDYLPLTPSAGIGPHCDGAFYRLPNHYRSVSYVMPGGEGEDPDAIPGAIVFKGTEPLLPDFGDYFDWMLSTPFRSSPLPLGLHFPLDMKLPPAAMWIYESVAEQEVATKLQAKYLAEYGCVARLPVPLFVFKYTDDQVARYAQTVRVRVSETAYKKFSNKLYDGLGVEVYYYPSLPVRVADLASGNLAEVLDIPLSSRQVTDTTEKWTRLLAELLQLRYMPYVPWHHGMGGCVDTGNVCLDGGFNDLLTLSPFDAIPSQTLMRRSYGASLRLLADSIAAYCNAAAGASGTVAQESDASMFAQRFTSESVRRHLQELAAAGRAIDGKLMKCLEQSSTSDIIEILREEQQHRGRKPQYVRARTAAPVDA